MTSLLDDTTPILVQELGKCFLSLNQAKNGTYYDVVISDGDGDGGVLVGRLAEREPAKRTYNKLKEMLA